MSPAGSSTWEVRERTYKFTVSHGLRLQKWAIGAFEGRYLQAEPDSPQLAFFNALLPTLGHLTS
jgi:hypothetical protein